MRYIVGEPKDVMFEREGSERRSRTVEVSFLNHSGEIEKVESFGVLEEQEVNDLFRKIKLGQTINLNYTYVKNFDISTMDDIGNDDHIRVSKFSAVGAFFDGNTNFNRVKFSNHRIDFSYAIFNQGYVNFSLSEVWIQRRRFLRSRVQ